MSSKPSIHHLRRHATSHNEAHLKLKELLRYAPEGSGWFMLWLISTLKIVVAVLLVAGLWMGIPRAYHWITTPAPQLNLTLEAYKTGMESVMRIHEQARRIEDSTINSILTAGSLKGIDSALAFSKKSEAATQSEELLKTSLWLTSSLSKGQYLTHLLQSNAQSLQKSLLATYLFGEKTVEINSVLETDTKILQRMQNALAVDVFEYLNQSVSRADALDNYVKLLSLLKDTADKRILELGSKIAFLQGNYNVNDSEIQSKEDAFFSNLQNLQGAEAEKALNEFIALQEGTPAAKAKIGAYKKVQEYYKFFQPRLDRLINEITLNREPLIAGVKVVDIQGMQLPLIVPAP